MTKVICDICNENKALYSLKFSVTDDDSFIGKIFDAMFSPRKMDICMECYIKHLAKKTKAIHCETCANKKCCAIHDNFNIRYCSDWQQDKEKQGSSAEKNKR